MAIVNFQPTIWSALILESLKKNLVFGSLATRSYQGDAKYGNTIKINSVSAISVRKYAGTATTDALSDTTQSLLIDQQDYCQFVVEDIDRVQSNADFAAEATREAGYALANSSDAYIASLHGSAGITANLGTTNTPIELNNVNVLTYLRLIAQLMNENNVPRDGRYIVIPPWFETKLKKAAGVLLTDNVSVTVNGFIGRIEGFDVYVSNNVVQTSAGVAAKILAGYSGSIAYVNQIDRMETLRVEGSIGDVMRALNVYGAKVIRANSLACLTANLASDA